MCEVLLKKADFLICWAIYRTNKFNRDNELYT